MIGKSGAQQEINQCSSEISSFIHYEARAGYDFPTNWRQIIMDHIELVKHILYTNDDSKVEPEDSNYHDGLQFTYIRRSYGEGEGANLFFSRTPNELEVRFTLIKNGKSSCISYEKNRAETVISFRYNGDFYSILEEK